jgi:hypothetical protein
MVEGSAEELIRQELKAVAEGVAASVFQSDTSNPEQNVSERNEPAYEPNQEKEDSNESVEMQHKAKLEVLNPFCFHCICVGAHSCLSIGISFFMLPSMVHLSDCSFIPIFSYFIYSGHEEQTA